MTAWEHELDRFEVTLAQQRSAVAHGRPQDVEAFVPRLAGPVPAELADRARALSAQADALTSQLSTATAAVARQLHVVTVSKRVLQRTASYVDQRC